MDLTEKLFGQANPPEGRKYDFRRAEAWLGRSGRGIGISWYAAGVGFGEVYFEVGPEGQVHIDTEMMSDEFVKELLCHMVEKATKDDQPKAWKTVNDYWQEGRAAEKGEMNPYLEADLAYKYWQEGYASNQKP